MGRSRVLGWVLTAVIVAAMATGAVLVLGGVGGESGIDGAPVSDSSPTLGVTAAPDGARRSSAVSVPSPTATPVARPPSGATATASPIPLPTVTTTPSAIATPRPTAAPMSPTRSPTPTTTAVPPGATPGPSATPEASATPAPSPTPGVDATPLPGLGRLQPGLHAGECLHCWVYAGRPPLPTAPEYAATELYLREHFSAASPRVGVCDTCPVVFSYSNFSEALDDRVLAVGTAPVGDGTSTLTLTFSRSALEVLDDLMSERARSIADGLLVPIHPDHNIRDVAGMLVFPVQTYPRHAFGSLAVTHTGYQRLAAGPQLPTVTAWTGLPTVGEIPGCLHCWRYVGYPSDVDDPVIDAIESSLHSTFTGSGGPTTCATCPWVMEGPDDLRYLVELGVSNHRLTRTPTSTRVLPTHGIHPMARYLLGPSPRSHGFAAVVGPDYSAAQVAAMLAWPGGAAPPGEVGALAITPRGLERLGARLAEPYTGVMRGGLGITPRDAFPISYCTSVPDGTPDAAAERLQRIARAGAEVWNDAIGITVFVISGTCPHAGETEARDLVGNDSNDITLTVFPLGPDGEAAGSAPRLDHHEFDIRISRAWFLSRDDDKVLYIVLHEMGHHLGLDHTSHARSVMSSSYSSLAITPWEIEMLRTWWGLD